MYTCTRCTIGLPALLLSGGFNLVDDGLWVNTPAVEVALVRKQVLGVMLSQRVRGRRRCADTQQPRNVLPRLILCHLQTVIR